MPYRTEELTSQQLLGRRLRSLRLGMEWRQKELANQLGRLTEYVSAVENGLIEADPHTLWKWLFLCGEYTPPPNVAPLNANPPIFVPPPGHLLREARINACLTQVDLASTLKCSQSYVCQIELGYLPVSDNVHRRWLRACGLPTSTVLG